MNSNVLKFVFRVIGFPEYTLIYESQRELQFIISEILGDHDIDSQVILLIDLSKKLILL